MAGGQHSGRGDPPSILLPAGKPPVWLRKAATTAEAQVLAGPKADGDS